MSIELTEEEFKTERDKIQILLTNIQSNFKELESMLVELETEKEPKLYYLFDEFQRHGQELIDFFTNERIKELYEK